MSVDVKEVTLLCARSLAGEGQPPLTQKARGGWPSRLVCALSAEKYLCEPHPSTLCGCGQESAQRQLPALLDTSTSHPSRSRSKWCCLGWQWWVVPSCFCGRPLFFSPICSQQSSSPLPTKHTQVSALIQHTHTHT